MTSSNDAPDSKLAMDRSGTDPSVPALVLGGGGARAAYQAGVLRYTGEAIPEAEFPLVTGVSAGAINAAHLAGDPVSFPEATERLIHCWQELRTDRVARPRSLWTLGRRWLSAVATPQQSVFHTDPLRHFLADRLDTDGAGRLTGVAKNIEAGRLRALAVTTSSYATMQTVTWVQGCEIEHWERPNRVGIHAPITLDHIMASTALPVLFPAVSLPHPSGGMAWHGDGGLRLLDPLAPALHLGADRLFVISTRYERSRSEADVPSCTGYPSPLQMAGILANVLLLDVLEHDAAVLRRINRLLHRIRPTDRPYHLQPVDLLIMRPSVDLGQVAVHEPLPVTGAVGALVRVLESQQGGTPDWLSMLRFQPEYIDRLLEIGYEDAHRQRESIEAFFARRADRGYEPGRIETDPGHRP